VSEREKEREKEKQRVISSCCPPAYFSVSSLISAKLAEGAGVRLAL